MSKRATTSRRTIIHLALTPAEADALGQIADRKMTTRPQALRDALALVRQQQPTAALLATTVDAAMDRIAGRIQSAVSAAMADQVDALRSAIRADIQSMAALLLQALAPGVEIVGAPGTPPPAHRPRSTPATPLRSLAELAAQQARGST